MPRYFCATLLTSLMLVAPASAQTVNDARKTARAPWSPEKMTALVTKGCGIPRAFFTIDRDYDGYARLRESPSITPDQHKCATTIVQRSNIPIRK